MTKTTTLIFDWGDTLMRVFPEYDGPMVDWPRVEAVSGIHQALEQLMGQYRLVVATNAGESGSARVRAALDRVGLGGFFDEVFTAKDLGANKPSLEFYQKVIQQLGCTPEAALMVGDGYANDVLGARAAGIRTAWYNPAQTLAPKLYPLQDVEVAHLAQLPGAVNGKFLPTPETCIAWLEEQKGTGSLVSHCRMVAAAAYDLAVQLRQRGIVVNPLLAHRGGLLHDLDKVTCDEHGMAHGSYGEQLLREKGQPELAEIAGRHLLYTILDPDRAPRTWEERLVFYADKLVELGRVVSLPERFAGLSRRYSHHASQIMECLEPVTALEREISIALEVSPQCLVSHLQGLVK